MKTLVSIALLMLIALCAFGQTATKPAIYIGGGTSATSDGPAFNITTGICSDDTTTCALLNYAARGSIKDLKSVTYTTTAGVRRVVASADANGSKVDLFVLADAGAAVDGAGPSLTGAGGGGLTVHPKRAPNWGITFAAQGAYDKDSKAHPNLFFQVGYTFHAAK